MINPTTKRDLLCYRAILLGLVTVPTLQGSNFAQDLPLQPRALPSNQAKQQIWSVYVNGMNTTRTNAGLQAQAMADNLGRQVHLIYNNVPFPGGPQGILIDGLTSAACKIAPLVCGELERASNELFIAMRGALQSTGGVLDVHAFSQGAILTNAALVLLREDPLYKDLTDIQWQAFARERLRVTTYGAGQHIFNVPNVLEFGFNADPVTVGTRAIDHAYSAYAEGVGTKAPVADNFLAKVRAGTMPPEQVVSLSSDSGLRGAHDFMVYSTHEAEFRSAAIFNAAQGDGSRIAEMVRMSIVGGELSDALHRRVISGLSVYNARTASVGELAELRRFAHRIMEFHDAGELGEFKLTRVELALLTSQMQMDPRRPTSSGTDLHAPSVTDVPTSQLPTNPHHNQWFDGWLSSLRMPAREKSRVSRQGSDVERLEARIAQRQDRMRELRLTRQVAGGSEDVDDVAAAKLMETFRTPNRWIEELEQQGSGHWSERRDSPPEVAVEQLPKTRQGDSKATGLGIVSAAVSIFGTPVAGAVVRMAGEAAMNRKVSPGTLLQGLTTLAKSNSEESRRLDISALTNGIDTNLPANEFAWQVYQRIASENPALSSSPEFNLLSKDQLTEMLLHGGSREWTHDMKGLLRSSVEASLARRGVNILP